MISLISWLEMMHSNTHCVPTTVFYIIHSFKLSGTPISYLMCLFVKNWFLFYFRMFSFACCFLSFSFCWFLLADNVSNINWNEWVCDTIAVMRRTHIIFYGYGAYVHTYCIRLVYHILKTVIAAKNREMEKKE